MKYIMTLVWSVILVSMLNYVVSSVQNVEFDLNNGLIMSIPVAILVILISAILPNDPVATPEHH
ncbi:MULTISPECIES: YjzD family protein [unclassified Bacillus (in: firmicutes)]|uniref:YjzD family protein n=1 Tax=Bacillaceae TaxID=186817 RepID=UPI0006AED5FD|nr:MULTISPECIES: YjzD family protein [unclassified Bacillus (in: firmicutes)]ALC86296.1 DeoR faimly transcriptional regulator [Bacillus sp. FJAT-22090]MDF2065755.1 YjzD family protein [Bacillus sp. Cr_A10]